MEQKTQTPIKQYNQLNEKQKDLYVKLGDLLETYAKDNNLNNKTGIKDIFETLITLTVAMKALYLMTAKDIDNKVDNKTTNDDANKKDRSDGI